MLAFHWTITALQLKDRICEAQLLIETRPNIPMERYCWLLILVFYLFLKKYLLSPDNPALSMRKTML